MRRGFVIHHNGPPVYPDAVDHARCDRFWAAVKRYHTLTKGWPDIAYSFGVCRHGTVYTGRGWYLNQFANGSDVVGVDDGGDREWFTVLAFLGEGETPTVLCVESVRALIDRGRREGHCGRRVLPHNAFKPKACPGPEFTAYAGVWDDAELGVVEAKGDDELTPEQDRLLRDVHAWMSNEKEAPAVKAAHGLMTAADIVGTLQDSLKQVIDPDVFAVAVAERLPGVSVESVTAAVRAVFADAAAG